MSGSSLFSGFYKSSSRERLQFVKEFADLTDEATDLPRKTGSFLLDLADRMIENEV
jgi:hydroxymethylglutaryl-CoA reductase